MCSVGNHAILIYTLTFPKRVFSNYKNINGMPGMCRRGDHPWLDENVRWPAPEITLNAPGLCVPVSTNGWLAARQ